MLWILQARANHCRRWRHHHVFLKSSFISTSCVRNRIQMSWLRNWTFNELLLLLLLTHFEDVISFLLKVISFVIREILIGERTSFMIRWCSFLLLFFNLIWIHFLIWSLYWLKFVVFKVICHWFLFSMSDLRAVSIN